MTAQRRAGPLAAALAAACVLALAGRAHGLQPATPPPARAATEHSGRSFAGIVLRTDALTGGAEFVGVRAVAWSDGPAQRLTIAGDVRVRLGAQSFVADRAAVWIEPVPGQPGRRQVAAYLDRVRNPAGAPSGGVFGVAAPRLLVTAVIDGPVDLRADRLDPGPPPGEEFLAAAEARFARFLDETVRPPAPPAPAYALRTRPGAAPRAQAEPSPLPGDAGPAPEPMVSIPPPGERRPPAPGPTTPERAPPGAEPSAPALPAEQAGAPEAPVRPPFALPPQDPALGPAARTPAIPPRDGTVSFFGPTTTFVRGETENAVVVSGGVAVQYAGRSGETLQITAQSAVAFLEPGAPAEALRAGADQVRGIYLEGDVVATDGAYTLRAPRMFYDVRTNRAIALDAVFWTYDRERSLPLYVRAKALTQESLDRWSGEGVRLANTSFFEPHLSLGATSVTITREPKEGDDRFLVDAQGTSFRLFGAPVVPLPRYRGEAARPPLRSVSVGARDGQPVLRTEWDLLTLLGIAETPGFTSSLLLDGYFSRGPAVGTDTSWSFSESRGEVFAYGIYDNGEDDLTSGAEIDRDNEFRGMVAFEHFWELDERWALFLEASYISDPAFVDAFFPTLAEERREFTNSAYARRRDDASLFSIEARGPFIEFTPNEYLLQSQGYQVEKLPEAAYSRVADTLLETRELALTWTSDTSVGRMAQRFNEPRLEEFGFDTPARAQAGFGLLPGDTLAQRLRAQGYTEDAVLRFDTRHELAAPIDLGAFNLTPFAVGRVTAYDDDFARFAPGEDDEYRLYGGGGARVSTTLARVDNAVESRTFDLHRIRHVVEPSATLWHGEATREQGTLPVYDYEVESVNNGTAFRAGVTNTWQTYRGGPGRWYSVDWFTLRTDYVWADASADRESPIRRWNEARPELSNLGEFIENEALLQLTDTVALSNTLVWDLEDAALAYTAAGIALDHGEAWSSFAEYRYIDARSTTLLDFGVRYRLSRKYAALASATWDFERTNLQSWGVELERRFPQATLLVGVSRDTITDDTVFAVSLRPVGLSGASRIKSLAPEIDRLDERPPTPVRTDGSRFGP